MNLNNFANIPPSSSEAESTSAESEDELRELLTIEGRSAWFRLRAGLNPDSLSLSRYLMAFDQAEETPPDLRDIVSPLIKELDLVNRYFKFFQNEEPQGLLLNITDLNIELQKISVTASTDATSLGSLSPVEVKGNFAMLAMPVKAENLEHLDLDTAAFFRLQENGKINLVESSQFLPGARLLVGAIAQSGSYQTVALPRDIDKGKGLPSNQPPAVVELWRSQQRKKYRWQSVGPLPDASMGGIGRVTQIDVHPTDGEIIIAAAASGGVWRSDNGGLCWRLLTENEKTLAMGAVAFAPSDPRIIYAASGEDAGGFSPSWPGAGVYRSANEGKTWSLTARVASDRFSAIAVHPTNPNVIYVAGNRGLHKSTDGGQTWINNPGELSLFDGQITDVVLDYDDTARVYIGAYNLGVFRSVTGGQDVGARAFTLLENGLPSGTSAGWIKLAIGRNGEHRSKFLAAKLGPKGALIHTSIDGGDSWQNRPVCGGVSSFFDKWTSIIAIDPADERRLYAAANQPVICRSDDGGEKWKCFKGGLHDDQQDLAFHPQNSNKLYLASDGGVYKSANAGESWSFASSGLVITQVFDLDITNTEPEVITCGAQDTGAYYRDSNEVWSKIDGGDVRQVAIDPNNPKIVYTSAISGAEGIIHRTINPGSNIRSIKDVGPNMGRISILRLSPAADINNLSETRQMFICVAGKLLHSTNSGFSFDPAHDTKDQPFVADGDITALEYAGSNPSVLYLATSKGILYKASAGGAAPDRWTRLHEDELEGLFRAPVSAISIDPNNPNCVWLAFAGNGVRPNPNITELVKNPLGISHVYKSIDGGVIWNDASGRFPFLHLPDVPTSAVVVDDTNPDVVYVGTDVGIFRTSNGGAAWESFQEGLPHAPISKLRLNTSNRTLFAATLGLGIYKRRLD